MDGNPWTHQKGEIYLRLSPIWQQAQAHVPHPRAPVGTEWGDVPKFRSEIVSTHILDIVIIVTKLHKLQIILFTPYAVNPLLDPWPATPLAMFPVSHLWRDECASYK